MPLSSVSQWHSLAPVSVSQAQAPSLCPRILQYIEQPLFRHRSLTTIREFLNHFYTKGNLRSFLDTLPKFINNTVTVSVTDTEQLTTVIIGYCDYLGTIHKV